MELDFRFIANVVTLCITHRINVCYFGFIIFSRNYLFNKGGIMKFWLGLVLVIVGAVLGVYVGLYLMFVKGIIQIVNSINPLVPAGIAWGIVKVIFANLVGGLIAFICLIPGLAMMDVVD